MKCIYCSKDFKNKIALTTHLKLTHDKTYKDYVIITKYDGVSPKCECGCGGEPVFYRTDFKRYTNGHDSFNHREKMYIIKYGIPRCLLCDKPVKFKRAIPNKFCGHSCASNYNIENLKSNSFTKNTNYISWLKKAYGKDVTNISQVVKSNFTELERGRRSSWLKKNWIRVTENTKRNFISKFHLNMRTKLKLDNLGFVSEVRFGKYRVDEVNKEKQVVIEFMGIIGIVTQRNMTKIL